MKAHDLVHLGTKVKGEGDPVCRCHRGLAIILLDGGKRICSQCWLEKEKEERRVT